MKTENIFSETKQTPNSTSAVLTIVSIARKKFTESRLSNIEA